MKNLFQKFLVFIVIILFFSGILYFFVPSFFVGSVVQFNRWSSDLESKKVVVDDLKWVYLEGGEGEPLVMLHGFGLHKDLWGTFPRYFRGKYHMIVPDLPGFGESTRRPALGYSVREQTERVKNFLNRIGIKKFHLLGFSMGGGIAANLAIKYPERVRSLVLIGAFGASSPEKSDAMKIIEKYPDMTLAFKNEKEFDFVNSLVYLNPRVLPVSLKNYFIEEGKQNYPLHSRIFKELVLEGFGFIEGRLSSIKSPALILWGQNDRIFHNSTAEVFHRKIKNSRMKILKDSGHMVFVEKPEEAGLTCIEFLEKQKAK